MTEQQSLRNSFQTQETFVNMAPAVFERLLGDPSSRSPREWRWRRKGSLRLNLDTGTWNDFESGEGGGVLALVMREERCDKAGALKWLQHHGFLGLNSDYTHRALASARSASSRTQRTYANQMSSVRAQQRDRRDTLRWIRSQLLPIADNDSHPVRKWLARRNLWRIELPLPPSMRWIPSDAAVFRKTHTGAGAIAFPLAPIGSWRDAYPDVPVPTAVQLVCIDADGQRANYRNSQGNWVDKPKFGSASLAVWTVGDITSASVSVCEGAADALALASRESDPVIATLTTPRPPWVWQQELSVYSFVTLWPDMDTPDRHGRRPGRDASVTLAQARHLAGQATEVMGVDVGKDAADAAREAPFCDIDEEALREFATELEAEGMTRFEARRYASVMLK